ncbi:N-acetyltransferase domain-containing protein [Gammaproteobacteria bacterium]
MKCSDFRQERRLPPYALSIDPMPPHPLNIEYHSLGKLQIQTIPEGRSEQITQQLCRMDPWRALNYSPTRLSNYLMGTDPCLRCRIIVATDPDNMDKQRVAGLLCVRYPWLFGACLELLAIFPDYQKMGLGTEVLSWLERRVAADARNLWILVSAFNESARSFYRRQGYTEIAKIDDLIQTGCDEILLRKELAHLKK